MRKRTPHVLPTLISRAWVWNDLILAIEKTWPTAASSVKLFSATKRSSQSNWIIFSTVKTLILNQRNDRVLTRWNPAGRRTLNPRHNRKEPGPTQPLYVAVANFATLYFLCWPTNQPTNQPLPNLLNWKCVSREMKIRICLCPMTSQLYNNWYIEIKN